MRVHRRIRRWIGPAVIACAASACDAGSEAPLGTSATSAASAAPRGKPTAEPTSSSGADARLELLRMTVTSGVKNKEPEDTLDSAKPGQRVYAHLAVRNRGADRKITLAFYVKDKERSSVTLDVSHSWSWRTWGFVTLRDDDRGELLIVAYDETHNVMAERKIPIH